jgi:hypothetical protein
MTLLGAPVRASVLTCLTVSFVTAALAACSPSTGDGGGAGAQQNSGSGPGNGGAINGGSGGVAPSGGTGASTGGTTVGGGGSGAVASTGGTTFVPGSGGQTNVPPGCNTQVVDPGTLPACTGCTGGRCVAKADYPGAPLNILASCDPNTVCLPDPIVATKGNVLLKQCTSVLGNEGRCTSLCIPIAQQLSGVLPQSVCSPDERCAPCFNPTDGSETGVCKVGCDPGPGPTPPILFQKCCNNRGDCVPRSNIPGAAAGNLSKLDCAGADDPVCVPSDIVKDPTYRFPACTSSTTVPGVSSGPGVCIPQCIVNANSLGRFLGRGDCANPDDKCAPCNDPTGKPTGACVTP